MSMKPFILKKGEIVGIVAPASPCFDESKITRGKRVLEELGYKVALGKHLFRRNGYLAGSDKQRREDLMEMFCDKNVKGIICLRGGYGSIRLLSSLDYKIVQENPKIFLGYSDITALHLAIYKKTKLVTFYGPAVTLEMVNTDFSYSYTCKQMLKALTSEEPLGEIKECLGETSIKVIAKGTDVGELIGGYLSQIVATLGTPYEIETRGKILFFEEMGKEPYQIDCMLTQLLLAGKLQNASGIAIGEFVNCKSRGRFPCSFTLEEVLQDRLARLGIPVLSGLCFGHGKYKATLPLGIKALLDTKKKSLTILEPAVSS